MSADHSTVLVVDDEVQVVDLYEAWLEARYDVRTASSGEEALQKVDEDVDAVLLDRRMPEMSGDEVLDEMRDRGLDQPVAMVTAIDPDFDVVDMEFDAYLTKPVTRDDLEGIVRELLAIGDVNRRERERRALEEKRETLEEEKPDSVLEGSDEFADLTKRLEETRKRLEERAEELQDRTED